MKALKIMQLMSYNLITVDIQNNSFLFIYKKKRSFYIFSIYRVATKQREVFRALQRVMHWTNCNKIWWMYTVEHVVLILKEKNLVPKVANRGIVVLQKCRIWDKECVIIKWTRTHQVSKQYMPAFILPWKMSCTA